MGRAICMSGLLSVRSQSSVIRMEHTNSDPVAENVKAAVRDELTSVRNAALTTGIAYTTLDRRLKDGETFTVGELRRLAAATGRTASDFLGDAS